MPHPRTILTKFSVLILLLLGSLSAGAQKKGFYGRVADEKGYPIPYAVVQLKNWNLGTYTDEGGLFYFEVDTAESNALIVSCVGYEQREVSVDGLSTDSIIVVLKGNLSIPEVTISAKQGEMREVRLGKNKEELIYKGQVYFNIGDEMAIFLPPEKKRGHRNGYLKEVYVYITNIGKEHSRLRLHVYDIDPNTDKPKTELTDTNIIVHANVGNEWVRVDLSGYKIPVSPDGVYVGLEWISGYGNDPKERWRRGLFTYHSPVVGFTQSYGGRAKRFCRLAFSPQWGDGEYKKYRLSPMVYASYTYRDNS